MTEAEIHARRKLAVRLLEWSCADDRVDEDHPRYRLVTEGRDVGAMRKRYSSCADLAHWLYFRLGVREAWINRAEHRGWKSAVNVARIVTQSKRWTPLADVQGGDVLVIANDWPRGRDAHVVCVIDWFGDEVATAEYGQPGGVLAVRAYRDGYLGSRKIRTWLSLDVALIHAWRHDALADPDLTLLG